MGPALACARARELPRARRWEGEALPRWTTLGDRALLSPGALPVVCVLGLSRQRLSFWSTCCSLWALAPRLGTRVLGPAGWRLGCDGLGLIPERKEEFLGQIPCFCPLFVGCGLGIPPFHPRRRPVERLMWAPGSPGRVCPCGGFRVLGAGLRLCVVYCLIPTVRPHSTGTTTGRWPGSSHMPAWSWAPWGMEQKGWALDRPGAPFRGPCASRSPRLKQRL